MFWNCLFFLNKKQADYVTERVMKRMIKESSEGEFEFSENDTVAMSKNGWVKISFLNQL